MNTLYSSSVNKVPDNLTEPTSSYKKHVWLALAGIILFFLFYLALTFWFFYSGYRLFSDAYSGSENAFISFALGLGVTFLAIFMVKAFFFVTTKWDTNSREITQQEEPLLFDYLYKLADEAGAPRPHKVYLSNMVNAMVFYDLSILNLFFPSKKNLEIGLGLINVLNLGEFKAVLAHEFGHFAQRSMMVGRYVYIANQIATTIINRRDVFDKFLNGLSSVDIRIAWVGWILSIIVWSIRSIVEAFFRIVVLSQRALSKEMEFQADLVAVSLTGSDALIHALHKLQAADQAFSSAIGTAESELAKNKAVEDVYALQSNAIEKTALILNDKTYGQSPIVPSENPATHRVFSSKIAQPPKMWATHPPDNEREENAKRIYIPASIDDRSSWLLFSDPETLKLEMTRDLFKDTKVETAVLPKEESIQNQNIQYQRSFFKPKYKGAYLKRFLFQHFQNAEDVYLKELPDPNLDTAIQNLYPEELVDQLEDYTSYLEEKHMLEAIHHKVMDASGTGIWHRGTQIQRKELPEVIKSVSAEAEAARLKISKHDRLVRTVHLKLAEKIGQGWDVYLKHLLGIIHYAEHSSADLKDAHGVLANVFAIVTADGRVSSSELTRLVHASNDVHDILFDLNKQASEVKLDKNLLAELETESWREKLESLTLPPANHENMQEWIDAIDGWVNSYDASLVALRTEALEVLLQTEDTVQQMAAVGGMIIPAPSPSNPPNEYSVFMPGDERHIQRKLGAWDRFITADGVMASLGRFAVAASIVGATVYMVTTFGESKVSIYNGLSDSIEVNINGNKRTIASDGIRHFPIKPKRNFTITAKTSDGDVVETFEPKFTGNSSNYFYNIAGAGALIEYTVYYGGSPRDNNRLLGNERWGVSKADYIFSEPPNQIETSGNSTTRDALAVVGAVDPGTILNYVTNENHQQKIIKAHALWDAESSPYINAWLAMSGGLEDFETILNKRLTRNPHEVVSIRAFQDYGSEELREAYCTKYSELSGGDSENSDFFYLASRCIEDKDVEAKSFLDGSKKWPENGWLAYAAAYVYSRDNNWLAAHKAMTVAYKAVPSLRDRLSIDFERINRVLKAQGVTTNASFSKENSYVNYYNSIASGTDEQFKNSPAHAYYHIEKGDLELALTRVQNEPDYYNTILALVASSDGAKEAWIDEALTLKLDENFNTNTVWAILALAAKRSMDLTIYQSKLEEVVGKDDAPVVYDFLRKIKAGDYNAAEELVKNFGLYLQGELYAMACTVKGKAAPKKWRQYAQQLLFASERGYYE